mmetsp:Transcript_2616/g.9241  ORF Transcript_2616/g.9241 Transcript_2616/m.9241 type:complete len:479 (-) Transcript_2616:738-2174(-)
MSFFGSSEHDKVIVPLVCKKKKFIICCLSLEDATACFDNYVSLGIPEQNLFLLYQFYAESARLSSSMLREQVVLQDTFEQYAGSYGEFISEQLGSRANALMRARLDLFDPAFSALVVFDGLFVVPSVVMGRQVLFNCNSVRFQLEDKIGCTKLLTAAGLLSDYRVHNVSDTTSILQARESLDKGFGVVTAAGGKWSSGASGVMHIASADSDARCMSLLPETGDVRIMPFIPGIPVELTFIIFKDKHICILQPEEGLTLMRSDQPSRFVFYGINSLWRPNAKTAAVLKSAAHKLACFLRDELDYLGVCNLNGMLDEFDNFTATEFNARVPGPRPRRVFQDELYFLDAAINSFSAQDIPSHQVSANILQAQEDTAGVYILNFAADMKLVSYFPRTAFYSGPSFYLKVDGEGDVRFCHSNESADVIFGQTTVVKSAALYSHFQTQARPLLAKCLNYLCKHVPATEGPKFTLSPPRATSKDR